MVAWVQRFLRENLVCDLYRLMTDFMHLCDSGKSSFLQGSDLLCGTEYHFWASPMCSKQGFQTLLETPDCSV